MAGLWDSMCSQWVSKNKADCGVVMVNGEVQNRVPRKGARGYKLRG